MLASSLLLHVNFNITDEFFCFPDSRTFTRFVAGAWQRAIIPSDSYSQHFGTMAARDEPSSFLYISRCNKCATVLRTVLYCCGMQTLAPGRSLHSSTHSSLSQCWRGSIKFRCISKYTAPFYFIFFLHFSQRGFNTLCAWVQEHKHFEGRTA